MADQKLKDALYGKTMQLRLADNNEYTFREPCIDELESLKFDASDPKGIKKLVWTLVKNDNPGLTQEKLGKIVTFSMLQEGSELLDTIQTLLGTKQADDESKND